MSFSGFRTSTILLNNQLLTTTGSNLYLNGAIVGSNTSGYITTSGADERYILSSGLGEHSFFDRDLIGVDANISLSGIASRFYINSPGPLSTSLSTSRLSIFYNGISYGETRVWDGQLSLYTGNNNVVTENAGLIDLYEGTYLTGEYAEDNITISFKNRSLSGQWYSNVTPTQPYHIINKQYIDSIFVNSGEQNFTVSIPTGQISYFIPFSPNFSSVPRVFINQILSNTDSIYSMAAKHPTISGFTLQFADIVSDTGISIDVLAKNTTGYSYPTFKSLNLEKQYASSTGSMTLNASAGAVFFAPGQTGLLVTNSYVTTGSVIITSIATINDDMTAIQHQALNGVFWLYSPYPPSQQVRVDFIIV